MAMITVYTYRTGGGKSCPVCASWDGAESEMEEELPGAPNPDCLSGGKCHCRIEQMEKDDGEDDDGDDDDDDDGDGDGDGGDGGGDGGGGDSSYYYYGDPE